MNDEFLGMIALFPDSVLPDGWHVCDGTMLHASRDFAFVSLVGARFGGDGRTTAALPDYRGVGPRGSRYCICLRGVYPRRD